MGDNI
jgi:hypothetical protein